jgi:hypothetical protein
MAKKTDHLVVVLKVKWDTDGQRGLKLPKTLNVQFPFNSEYYKKTISAIHDEANDIASDMIGFCVDSSQIIQVFIQKL